MWLQQCICCYWKNYYCYKSNNEAYDKKLVFENNASFISCISKIDNALIDKAEELHIVMPMYNLNESSKNYSRTTGSLENDYKDEANSGAEGNINYPIKHSKSFDYKAIITQKWENDKVEKENVEIVVPLAYLRKFWRTLVMPLINCEVSLTLTWS